MRCARFLAGGDKISRSFDRDRVELGLLKVYSNTGAFL